MPSPAAPDTPDTPDTPDAAQPAASHPAIDLLAICAHPDDAELHCSGLLLMARQHGARIGVIDLTRGEAASRGTPELRQQEAAAAAAVLGLSLRENLGWPDARLASLATGPTAPMSPMSPMATPAAGLAAAPEQPDYLTTLITLLRRHRPRMVLTSHWDDHHPDHSACSMLVQQACYLAGIGNYPASGQPHRPEQVLYYLDRLGHRPDLVQDISAVFAQKLAAVQCYASQLHNPHGQQLATPLASPDYLTQWQGRQQYYGSLIGVPYGEAYVLRQPVPLANPLHLLWGRQGIV